jgi:hypothetical protein
MAHGKANIQGPSDLGSGHSGSREHPAFSNPADDLEKPQATGAIGGYKVFCDVPKGKGANIQGVSSTDLAAQPGPGSSKGLNAKK